MERKIFLIILIFIIQFSILNSQDTWIQTYQPFGDEVDYFVEDIRVCPDDGYAIIGSIWNSELSTNDGFMMKTDSDGNMLWASIDTVSFISGPEPSGFVVLDDGSFITVGNNFWFGGRYLLKRNPYGVIEWTVELDNDYGTEAIELTNDGNMVTTGGSMDGSISLQKFDLNGNLIWRETYLPDGFDYGVGYSVTQNIDNGYAISGIVDGPNNWDILVLKTDETGDSLWTWTYDGYGFNDKGNCIIEDNNQNIFVSGGIFQQTRAMYTFIAKLDNSGDSLWFNEIPDMAECFSILQINNENAFAGYSWSGSSTNKTRLYKFNEEGCIIWNEQLPHWPAEGDRCFQVLENDGFICSGRAQWGENITITKCDSIGSFTETSENTIPFIDYDIICYPNPFNPQINFEIKLNEMDNYKIEIFNIKGQFVKSISLERNNILWNAEKEASGVYFCKLLNKKTGISLVTKKITLLK